MSERILNAIEEAMMSFLHNMSTPGTSKQYIVMKAPLSPDAPKTLSGEIVCNTRNAVPFTMQLRVISQIYDLVKNGKQKTKRDLYYAYKQIYGTQHDFGRALSAVCRLLNASRLSLNVLSCSRGYAVGNFYIWRDMDDVVDFRNVPVSIIEEYMDYSGVTTQATFILVVEKECVFQELIDANFTEKFPGGILLTGRGYPDICTRRFLRWLCERVPLRVLSLMDADPHGIEIYATYRYGSMSSDIEAGGVKATTMEWFGLLPSEISRLPIANTHPLKLQCSDYRKIVRLQHRAKIYSDRQMADELEVLADLGKKFELESMSTIAGNFLSDCYLEKLFNF